MRTAPASLVCLLLGVALLGAPLVVADAALPAGESAAADVCCGLCPAEDVTTLEAAPHECCSAPTQQTPASSGPCDSEGSECPCCTVTAPMLLAILVPSGQTFNCAGSAGVLTANDQSSDRCDEPLLPPPRS